MQYLLQTVAIVVFLYLVPSDEGPLWLWMFVWYQPQ